MREEKNPKSRLQKSVFDCVQYKNSKFDEKFIFSQNPNQTSRKGKRKKEKTTMSTTTTTTLQELLQCEEDSFIPDDLDDKFYDDNTYNWEVMFETVK